MIKTKTERIQMLRAQQKKLMEKARETAEDTMRRIQKQTTDEIRRIKLYKDKESHKEGLQTKKLMKRKTGKIRRRKEIMNEVDAMFR